MYTSIYIKEKNQKLRTVYPLHQPLKNMYIPVILLEHNVTVSICRLHDYNLACIVIRYITLSISIENVQLYHNQIL